MQVGREDDGAWDRLLDGKMGMGPKSYSPWLAGRVMELCTMDTQGESLR